MSRENSQKNEPKSAATPLLLGIDAGTTRIRALAFEANGELVATGSTPTPTLITKPDWAEYDPQALWEATVSAIREVLSKINSPDRIVSIAVASVGEAGIPLDQHGRPTHSAIAWFDQRTTRQVELLNNEIGQQSLFEITGLYPDLMFGLCKLLWIKANAPESFEKTVTWLNIADYLAWRLSGVMATDLSLASRTLALDIRHRQWSTSLLQSVGIKPTTFAALTPSGTALGPVTINAAATTGLPRHCIVGVGGHDQILGLLAATGWKNDILLDSMGTAEAILMSTDAPIFDIELLDRGYSQGAMEIDKPRGYIIGGMTTSGACIEWFRNVLGNQVDHETLISEGEQVPPGSLGVGFLPQMRVSSPPVRTPVSRGVFYGLTPDCDRGSLYRAVLEGLAFDATNVTQNLGDVAGVPVIERVMAIGGNSRNALLMRIKATAMQQSIDVVNMPEATSLGAALLGGLAAGVFESMDAALSGLMLDTRVAEPVEHEIKHYTTGLSRYKAALRALEILHSGSK